MIIDDAEAIARLDFARGNGLIPVIAQHAITGEVLMLAYANAEAITRTIDENVLWFYSRSRGTLWRKGDTSGNAMRVVELHGDCDSDAMLALVLPAGPACHTGDRTCFSASPTLVELADTIAVRAAGDGPSYTRKLLDNPNLRLKKLGEEAVELAVACSRGDAAGAAEEAADLLYHALVACHAAGASVTDVLSVLEGRSARAVAAVATSGPGSADRATADENAVDQQ